jgi:tyrosyl-tRNA synthetase
VSGAAVLDELAWRGQLAQSTDLEALRAELAAGPLACYGGFDPTAPSLHIGNLVLILLLRRFQLAGHPPVAVVGGATGLIGDPSGRSTERGLHDAATVAGWTERLHGQISRFLDFDGPAAARIVNNLDWTGQLSAIAFLRDVGKHFPVNRMLDREAIATRLAGGLSYTEFSYLLLQAYDYLELHRRYGVRLQLGGSDQWGNITAGVDFVRRSCGAAVHALTAPLVTKSDGTKFGKTAGGAVWLDPTLTSPYAFYQFWVNADDADVGGYLRTFTFLDRTQIEEAERSLVERPAAREAARRLAVEVTTLVHGPALTADAVAASEAIFGSGDLRDLPENVLAAALAELPGVRVSDAGATVGDLLVETGLVTSRSEARRVIAEGGAYLNNARVSDAGYRPGRADLLHGRFLLLRRGRRTIAGVEFTAPGPP